MNKAVKMILFVMVTSIIGWLLVDEKEQNEKAEQLITGTTNMGQQFQQGNPDDLQKAYDDYAGGFTG